MKRFITALIAVLYMVAGTGFTLRQHYCMGQHIGTVIAHPADASDVHRCDRCGMEKKNGDDNGCCKDQFKTFKSATDHNTISALHLDAPDFVAILPQASYVSLNADDISMQARIPAAPAHGPPDDYGPPRFLRLRCILI